MDEGQKRKNSHFHDVSVMVQACMGEKKIQIGKSPQLITNIMKKKFNSDRLRLTYRTDNVKTSLRKFPAN